MFKRPTSRRRSDRGQIVLNLVPMLDALVTLVTFLLFTMTFISIVTIESQLPISSRKINKRLKTKPLQLTLSFNNRFTEIWSPFKRIRVRKIPHAPDGTPNTLEIHRNLVQIKQKFPRENTIVFAPHGGSSYDIIIAVMDAARSLEKTDPPMYVKNKDGIDQEVNKLFPEIVFGNLLEGS